MQKTTKAPATVSVKKIAQQHVEILRVADTPHLAHHESDLTIAPYGVWITYRREAGTTETTWEADVSGHRVLANGEIDKEADSISLCETDKDLLPDWLIDLIEQFAPARMLGPGLFSLLPPPPPPPPRGGARGASPRPPPPPPDTAPARAGNLALETSADPDARDPTWTEAGQLLKQPLPPSPTAEPRAHGACQATWSFRRRSRARSFR
jgi:hypothetical protein